jgi:hypothetical protein
LQFFLYLFLDFSFFEKTILTIYLFSYFSLFEKAIHSMEQQQARMIKQHELQMRTLQKQLEESEKRAQKIEKQIVQLVAAQTKKETEDSSPPARTKKDTSIRKSQNLSPIEDAPEISTIQSSTRLPHNSVIQTLTQVVQSQQRQQEALMIAQMEREANQFETSRQGALSKRIRDILGSSRDI